MVLTTDPNTPKPIICDKKPKRIAKVKRTADEQFSEDGWSVKKKIRVTTPALEPGGVPRSLPAKSSPLDCFRALWTDNIIVRLADKINSKLEKTREPGKHGKLMEISEFFCYLGIWMAMNIYK